MAYDKDELEQLAIKAIKKNKLKFIQHLVAYLPCSSATFYNLELEKLETIKDLIDENRTSSKVKALNRWEKSKNPTLEVAFYKLIGDEEEVERLNGSKQKVENSGTINHHHTLDAKTIEEINKAYDGTSD